MVYTPQPNSPLPPRTADTPTKLYKGGCHCRKFEFECRHPILEDGFKVLNCNCSWCSQQGCLNIYIFDPQDFKMTKGTESELTQYRFHSNMVSHMFCPQCGSTFLSRRDELTVVNARALSDLDVDKLTLIKIDGRSF